MANGYVVAGATYTDGVIVKNGGGNIVDPDADTLTLTIKDPDGVVQLVVVQDDLTRTAAGQFSYDWTTEDDFDTGLWTWQWDASVDGVDLPDDAVPVVVLPVGSLQATITSLAQVRALVKTALSDDELSELIGREEAVLAAEVGALTGSRTETFVITDTTAGLPVRLRRRVAAVTVTQDNVATTDIRILPDERTVELLTASGWALGSWTGPVEVTYAPNDSSRVVSWVIELVRARLTEAAYFNNEVGDDGYNRGARAHEAVLQDAIADIVGRGAAAGGRSRGIRSVRMSTAGPGTWIGTGRP